MATKSATSIPATPINEQAAPVIEQAALSFLDQLTTLATPITDLSEVAAKKDPLVRDLLSDLLTTYCVRSS